MLNFNDTKDNYRSQIEKSISFTGTDHDFFIREKGKLINEFISQHLSPGRKATILDVGCGHGYVHSQLVAAGHTVTGVEIAQEVLSLAHQLNPTVDYRAYDGNTLPFPDGSFDMAIAMCVMHHVPVPNWDAFTNEIYRVVKPGGLVAIFEHNALNPVTHYLFKYGFEGMDEGATMVGRRRLESMLRTAGSKSVHSEYIFFTPFGSRFFRWMDRALAWLPFGAQYFTLARR